jgi:hypothetical protein
MFRKTFALAFVLIAFFSLSSIRHNAYAWGNGSFSTDPSNPEYGTYDWIAHHALDSDGGGLTCVWMNQNYD